MLQINKSIIALSIITSFSVRSMEVLPHSDFSQVILHHSDEKGFSMQEDSQLIPMQRCYMDKELRGISSDKLQRLLTAGAYLQVKKLDNSDDHALHLKARIEGGGPLFGKFCYWLVKGVGYGAPFAIATSTLGAAGGKLAGDAVGGAISIGSASQQSVLVNATISVANAPLLMPAQTISAVFSGLPVVGFAGAAVPAGSTAATLTAAQTAAIVASQSGITASIATGEAIVAANALPYVVPTYAGAAGVGVGKAIVATIGVEAAGAATAAVTVAASGVTGYVTAIEGAAVTAGVLGAMVPFLP